MRLIFSLLIPALVFVGISDAHSQELSKLLEVTRFHQAIVEADRRGDFSSAVGSAEQCLAFIETIQTVPGRPAGGFGFCAYYLGSALRNGKGIKRDDLRAFHLLSTLVGIEPDGRAALDLAEMYLDGQGTPRNPIEAAVLVWRVDHGAWSIYSPYWGMCTACEDTSVQDRALHERLTRDLTRDEGREAAAIEAARFPEIIERVRKRNTQLNIAGASVFAVVAGALWLWVRSARRRRARPS